MKDGDSIEFHRSEEWTAVYLNGKLARVGDSYLADEWLQDYVGVKVVDDDAFLRGGSTRAGVAQTLDELEDYRLKRDRLLVTAEELEAEAARLRAKATKLRSDAVSGLTPEGSCRA